MTRSSALTEDEMASVVMTATALFINAIEVMSHVVSERCFKNEVASTANTRCFLVVPQGLIKMYKTEFYMLVRQHSKQLSSSWIDSKIDFIAQ